MQNPETEIDVNALMAFEQIEVVVVSFKKNL